jgi:hypothetical protein
MAYSGSNLATIPANTYKTMHERSTKLRCLSLYGMKQIDWDLTIYLLKRDFLMEKKDRLLKIEE